MTWLPHRTWEERKPIRFVFLLAGLTALAICGLELLAPSVASGILPARAAFGVMMLVCGVLVRERASSAQYLSVVAVASLGAIGSAFAFAKLTGGFSSPYAGLLATTTLVLVTLARGNRVVALLSGATYVLLFGLLLAGSWAATNLLSALEVLVASSVMIAGAWQVFRRVTEHEAEAERERLHMLEAERRALLSERLALIGQLAAGVAHEINNPMAYVKANNEFVREQVAGLEPVDREVLAALTESQTGIQRVQDIVSMLLAFARTEPDTLEPVLLGPLVEDTVRLASAGHGGEVAVRVDLRNGEVGVLGNRQQLSQVLVNLLLNAADAVALNPPERPGRIQVAAGVELGRVRIVVEDNGPGIPPAMLSKVFDPFYTTKPPGKGTGLGLTVAREYTERFGGTLTVENAQPNGARFVVELPAVPASRSDLPPVK